VIRRSLIALVLAGAAASCANTGVVLSPASYYGAYSPSALSYSATSGGILVQVVGNPFDVPQADLERAVTGAMTGSHFGPAVDFVTARSDGFRSPYRIVMVFDSAQGYTEGKLCRESGPFETGAGEIVKVQAALCAGETALTGVSGRVAQVTGPDDPQFRRLISQITMNLLPPSHPDHDKGDRGIFL
jgi:hypothetical protein